MSLPTNRQDGDIVENEDINAIAAAVNDHEDRLTSVESNSGTSGSGLVPDPDFPGYYLIGEGSGGPVVYPPTITLGVTTESLTATATFTTSHPGGGPVGVSIDWGDGATTNLATSPATHAYATNGTYTVVATATAAGRTATDTVQVLVQKVVPGGAFIAAQADKGPVVHLPLTEAEAPFVDLQGVVTPTLLSAQAAVPGHPGIGSTSPTAAFNLNNSGTVAYSFGTPAALSGLTSWSVEFLYRPQASTRSRYVLTDVAASGSLFYVQVTGTNSLLVPAKISCWVGGALHSSSPEIISAGSDNHIVVTYDGTTLRFYRNGADVGSSSVPGVTVGTGGIDWRFAAASGTASHDDAVRGLVAGFAIYNRALTAAEIDDNFTNAGIGA